MSPKCLKQYMKKWQADHKDTVRKQKKEYDRVHKKQKKERDSKYIKTTRKQKRKKRRQIDFKFRLDSNISSIISTCLNGKKAGRKWESLVGYSVDDLIKHLEKQFDDKMSRENYGNYWWIDHIKPRSLFEYERPEDPQFKECWALKNLQPLEKITNIKKGNKYFQRSVDVK